MQASGSTGKPQVDPSVGRSIPPAPPLPDFGSSRLGAIDEMHSEPRERANRKRSLTDAGSQSNLVGAGRRDGGDIERRATGGAESSMRQQEAQSDLGASAPNRSALSHLPTNSLGLAALLQKRAKTPAAQREDSLHDEHKSADGAAAEKSKIKPARKWSVVKTEAPQAKTYPKQSQLGKYTQDIPHDACGKPPIVLLASPNDGSMPKTYELRNHVVVAGDDDALMMENYHAMANRAIAPQTRARIDNAVMLFKNSGVAITPENIAALREARLGSSQTNGDGNKNKDLARSNWDRADKLIQDHAFSDAEISPQSLETLFTNINKTLLEGVKQLLPSGEEAPIADAGMIRYEREVGICMDDNIFDMYPSLIAIPGSQVREEINSLFQEMSEGLQKITRGDDGAPNPIELAGRVYQKSVSIHPFSDGNGRSCRLLADFVLIKAGLLPAAIQSEDNYPMQFPRIAPDMNATTTHVTNAYLSGLEVSYKIAASA